MLDTCYDAWDWVSLEDNPSGSALVLGYLANIWNAVCAPAQPGVNNGGQQVAGSGFVDTKVPGGNGRFAYAILDLDPLPPSIDLVFGSNPLIYPGVCGFGVTQDEGSVVSVGGGQFNVGVAELPPAFGESRFINHQQTIWVPPSPVLNLFWWNLKPNVTGTLTIYSSSVGNGFVAGPRVVGPFWHWNPIAGGWVGNDQVSNSLHPLYDGCGNNVTPANQQPGGGGFYPGG